MTAAALNQPGPGCEDVEVSNLRRRHAVAAALAMTLLAAGCGGSSSGGSGPTTTESPGELHGAIPDVHAVRPSFRLVDTSGKPYDFAGRTTGRATMLYFGYTHCPDECPTSMADVASALRRVEPSLADKVDVVFVTTDPWRDKKPVLRRWLNRFDPAFVGLTGTPAQIQAAEAQMGMPISRRVPAKKSDGSGRYAVDHFAAVMAYGSNDRLATLYPSGITPAEIAADIPLLVEE
jgi:protein SCO1/2